MVFICYSIAFITLNYRSPFHKFLIPRYFSKLTLFSEKTEKQQQQQQQNESTKTIQIFSVAPMMDYTDCHQHYFHRLLSLQSILYTEMIGTSTLIHTNDVDRHLRGYMKYVNDSDKEKTILQLGGSNIDQMSKAARIATTFGFKHININSGCPSDKVAGDGCFGAALMSTPNIVADLAKAISHQTGYPATVKCRIGIDDQDSYEHLVNYVDIVSRHGEVQHFIIHARKAILGGKFSPADNRKIPPLKYEYVYRLVNDFPNLTFTLNGGIETIEDCQIHLSKGVHGVMVGRAAVADPFKWSTVDSKLYNMSDPGFDRKEVLRRYAEYAKREELENVKARRALLKPAFNLFCGVYNGRLFRQRVGEFVNDYHNKLIGDILLEAAECIS